jgi:nitroimidazol reductase NimA-like FMN-containing flavoprotein (pyridoxamine 5'-phosphate oxidase superfamily)
VSEARGSRFALRGSRQRDFHTGILSPLAATMLIHELTPTECRDVLSRANVARLACSRAEQPYVVPVSFAYDPESNCLFSFSTIGKKVNWMRENPKVCVEVEDVADRFHWTTVVIVGRYDEIGDLPEHKDVRQRALDLFAQRAEWWLPGAAKLSPHEHPDVVVYRIHVDNMTGRRAARDREQS